MSSLIAIMFLILFSFVGSLEKNTEFGFLQQQFKHDCKYTSLILDFLKSERDNGQIFRVNYGPSLPNEGLGSSEMTIIAHEQQSIPNSKPTPAIPSKFQDYELTKKSGSFLAKKEIASI